MDPIRIAMAYADQDVARLAWKGARDYLLAHPKLDISVTRLLWGGSDGLDHLEPLVVLVGPRQPLSAPLVALTRRLASYGGKERAGLPPGFWAALESRREATRPPDGRGGLWWKERTREVVAVPVEDSDA